MKFGWAIFSTIAVLVFVTIFYFFGPGGTGTLGRLVLEDKTEIRIIQTYNDYITEPYTVGFYIRRPGEDWGWCYMAHQDTRWSGVRLVVDEHKQSVQIYSGSTLRGEYLIDQKSFVLRHGAYKHESPAPQKFRNPPV